MTPEQLAIELVSLRFEDNHWVVSFKGANEAVQLYKLDALECGIDGCACAEDVARMMAHAVRRVLASTMREFHDSIDMPPEEWNYIEEKDKEMHSKSLAILSVERAFTQE